MGTTQNKHPNYFGITVLVAVAIIVYAVTNAVIKNSKKTLPPQPETDPRKELYNPTATAGMVVSPTQTEKIDLSTPTPTRPPIISTASVTKDVLVDFDTFMSVNGRGTKKIGVESLEGILPLTKEEYIMRAMTVAFKNGVVMRASSAEELRAIINEGGSVWLMGPDKDPSFTDVRTYAGLRVTEIFAKAIKNGYQLSMPPIRRDERRSNGWIMSLWYPTWRDLANDSSVNREWMKEFDGRTFTVIRRAKVDGPIEELGFFCGNFIDLLNLLKDFDNPEGIEIMVNEGGIETLKEFQSYGTVKMLE